MPPNIFRGRAKGLGKAFDQTLKDTTATGGKARAAGLAGALSFDPSQAVSEFGSGFLDEAREGLGQDFESLTGDAVGRGRFRTGFFQRDAGRLFQDFNRRVANAIALQSVNAAGLQQQNIQGLNRLGTDLLGQQTELIGGGLDRATAEENARGPGLFGRIAGGIAGIGAGIGVGVLTGNPFAGIAAGSAVNSGLQG